MSYDTLLPLIKKTGSTLTPKDFHSNVNVIFHDVEAGHYDALHANMWGSLQQQIDLLSGDILQKNKPGSSLKLLDIGCGTGLSTELLLNSDLGKFITDVTLLDTSANMLQQASERAKNWNKSIHLVNIDVTALNGHFDIIIVCSVLHHIPDLVQFLDKIDSLQRQGGILIHLQDPNGDYMADADYIKLLNEYESNSIVRNSKKKVTDVIPKPIRQFINKILGRKTYIDVVNDRLLEKEVIKKPMSAEEIWSVTDIHVEDLPYSVGSGISIKFLKETLKDYSLVNSRSYAFFGHLKSELLPEYQLREDSMIQSNELNGRHVAAAWIKK